MTFEMWNSLAAGPGGQGVHWIGVGLELAGSGGVTIEIVPGDLRDLMIFLLDSAVTQEFRQPRPDKYARARNSLGGSAGATLSGFTATQVVSRGTVLARDSDGATFDVGEPHSFCVMLASLAQSHLKDEAGLLQRM